jgi:hypothetical protein
MELRHYRFKCFNKLKLFQLTQAEDIVHNWGCILQEKYNCVLVNHKLYSHELHIYLLADEHAPIQKIIANGKRFMAYEIVFRLELKRRTDILRKLESGCSSSEIRKGQLHKVFETRIQKAVQRNYRKGYK